jgi:cell shape-determining protein MreD
MNWLHTVLVLGAAFLAVFGEAAFGGIRHLLGAQIDLLPPLMVYASLCTGLTTVSLVAACGGLWFDPLSANPLGVTVLPLFAIGFTIHLQRDLILRDQTFAQLVLGLGASAAVPVMTLLLLLTMGRTPSLGWGTLWQLVVLSVGGAIATPFCFWIFGWLHRTLVHHGDAQSSFRPDREIRRGRL